MDTDPLADVGPPRHAVESDEEDEFNPLSPPRPSPKHDLDFEIINTGKATAETLIFASLESGRIWAKGADLGEQLGTISINEKCVGMVFNPGWTDAIVVISEVLTRLPVWGQYPYAEYVLGQLKPTKLLLLDSYSASSYIHPEYIPLHRAPVRYLTLNSSVSIPEEFEPFSPPNLIQSASAAFLSLISLALQVSPQSSTEATVFLFPGPYHPLNPPDDLTPAVSSLDENDDRWSRSLTSSVHEALSGGKHEWNLRGKGGGSYSQEKRKPHVEGSMYI